MSFFRKRLGQEGEEIAEGFLKKKGYKLVERNYRCKTGEVDLIVLDPPTFSNSKSMDDVFDIQTMHVQLINTCLKKLSRDGILYFSTNARKFELEESLIKGAVKNITTATVPFDFKGKLLRWCYTVSRN